MIELLAEIVSGTENNRLITGIGDDAAAWQGDTSIQLATIDSLTQDVHFTLNTTSWKELGWKALAVNLSDIAAMGGVPRYALVSLGLPEDTETEDVVELYKGMIELAQSSEVSVVGGDTCRAPVVSITIAVFGAAGSSGKILTRSAARPGDKVAVTGYLGTAAAGWQMLTKQLRFDSEVSAGLRGAFLRPVPRIVEGQMLVRHGVKVAIDISDGLIADLEHVCHASQVSARIEVDHVPVHPMVRDSFGGESLELALSGGEDYELLFTASAEVIDRVKAAITCPVTVIGEIEQGKAGEVNLVDIKGKRFVLRQAGWGHFTAG